MKLLLDTHILLWAASASKKLSKKALKFIKDKDNDLFFSAASLWEISIKNNLGRDDFKVDPRLLRRGMLDNGYSELPIMGEHTLTLDSLPDIHKDPFDRILISQAYTEGFTLVTADGLVGKYPGPIVEV